MFKPYRLPLLTIAFSLVLTGCYTQSLVTPDSKANFNIGAKYKVTWDSAPRRSMEYLKGTVLHLKKVADGAYSLEYKQGHKQERKKVEPLQIGNNHYIQIFGAGAYQLMRVVYGDNKIDLYSEIPGCAFKNGDDKYPDVNMIKLSLADCAKPLGIATSALKIEGGFGRVIFQGKPATAIAFLEKYGEKMYGRKRYTLQPL